MVLMLRDHMHVATTFRGDRSLTHTSHTHELRGCSSGSGVSKLAGKSLPIAAKRAKEELQALRSAFIKDTGDSRAILNHIAPVDTSNVPKVAVEVWSHRKSLMALENNDRRALMTA